MKHCTKIHYNIMYRNVINDCKKIHNNIVYHKVINDCKKIHYNIVYRDDWRAVVKNEQQAEYKHAQHVDSQCQQKLEEISVIPSANAIVNPRTVMVKYLNTKHRDTSAQY